MNIHRNRFALRPVPYSGRACEQHACNRLATWRSLARELSLAVAIGAALATLAASAGRAQEDPSVIQLSGTTHTARIYIPTGKSQDVRTSDSFADITVGDPAIADVNPLTNHTLSILAKKMGTTRVSVYNKEKSLVGIFDVEVGYDTARIEAQLKRRFPRAHLDVSSINGKLMVSGEAPDAPTVDQAMQMVKEFTPKAINSIRVDSPQQVMLEVRFLELSRTADRELGVQWSAFGSKVLAHAGTGSPTATENLGTLVATSVLSGSSPYGFLLGRVVGNGVNIDGLINALEQKGIARSLAEPNLVALSGNTASFLAGGEYPIPVPGALGTVGIDYKRYGVGLAFTPTVLDHGLMSLKINPEVSQLDYTHEVTIALSQNTSIQVPPLIVRRASTTVELRDGQSFAIGGLLQHTGNTDQEQLPWMGDVPVLGALFRSASYQKNETDLVIVVTPHLVRPMRPGDRMRTPLDSTVPPNDRDFFLLGKNEIPRRVARAALGAELPLTGHIIDLPKRGDHAADTTD